MSAENVSVLLTPIQQDPLDVVHVPTVAPPLSFSVIEAPLSAASVQASPIVKQTLVVVGLHPQHAHPGTNCILAVRWSNPKTTRPRCHPDCFPGCHGRAKVAENRECYAGVGSERTAIGLR